MVNKCHVFAWITTGVFAVTSNSLAMAGSLSVTPTVLDIAAPAATAELLLMGSKGGQEILGQVRVVRWRQSSGVEELSPTRDVVASPPVLRLEPGRSMTVRLVRTLQTPITGEECYRVLVDELPNADQRGALVKLTIRQSLPLCFNAPNQVAGAVTWKLKPSADGATLSANNSGQHRVVTRDLKLSVGGKLIAKLDAAVVLGDSEMSWPLRGKILKAVKPGTAFELTGQVGNVTVSSVGVFSRN